MNKLTEIKERVNSMLSGNFEGGNRKTDTEEWIKHKEMMLEILEEDVPYLISLLEEKDKALQESKETIMDLMREYPSECWTSMDVKSWEDNGKEAIELIDSALNTSSNNEGNI